MQLSAFTSSVARFFSELQRRKVLRVASVYLVAAWIILQVALALQTAMSLAASFSSFVLALLVIGFPIALGLSWFFEVTPEGIKRTVAASDGALRKPQTTDLILIGALALVLALGLAQFFWPRETTPAAGAPVADAAQMPKVEPAALGDKSIAVLPFANLSPGKENEYFADGLTEELLNLLAKIGDLKVISRTSSFAFKGKNTPLPDIARQLGVRHILEGSVRTQGNELRVTAQLIDVATDTHVWSETYERKVENAFALQEEIARAIGGAMNVEVTLATVGSPPTKNLQAYRLYLEGLQYFRERDASSLKAVALFKDALALDPDFAEAHAALAASYWTSTVAQRDRMGELASLARASALAAIKLKPTLGLPYGVLGILDRNEFKWELALANLQRAIALDPADSSSRQWLGSVYSMLGRFDDGAAALDESTRLDPLSDTPALWLLLNKFGAGRDAEARRLAERISLSQRWYAWGAHAVLCTLAFDRHDIESAEAHCKLALRPGDQAPQLGATFAQLIQSGRAREAAIKATKARASADPKFNPSGVYFVLLANDEILESLERSDGMFAPLDPGTYVLIWAPRFKGLHANPRFKAVLRKLGYVDFWKKHGWPDRCRAKGEDDFECS